MTSKRELEDRINELELEVAALKYPRPSRARAEYGAFLGYVSPKRVTVDDLIRVAESFHEAAVKAERLLKGGWGWDEKPHLVISPPCSSADPMDTRRVSWYAVAEEGA
jgi:hypothetical protein